MAHPVRTVARITTAHRQEEGGGFIVRRPFPSAGLDMVDPFLLLDEMGPIDYAPGKAVGAPDHPHRGFETVTYVLDGEMRHEDSAGNRGAIGPGDVQWMTAGAGVVHSEEPARRILEEGGRVHGFQLWVNLPARDKMMAPRYQEVPSRLLPTATSSDGKASVRVIAGEALGVRAVIDTRTPIVYQDWTLQPGATVELPLGDEVRAAIYVFGGALLTGPAGAEERTLGDGQLAVLAGTGAVRLSVPVDARVPARALLLGGKPLGEPVARYGPFVMNTAQEIQQAMRDYQAGRMGAIVR